ncbi:MAG: hypothetical protein A2148_11365 [Chloroflexi bacterium RBG_16_68_14]|nr:MAG: hypothetical protein A2148_11365 [Chloroflexi bacterium RBG_16_68_14]
MTSAVSSLTIRLLEEGDLELLAHVFRFSRHHIEGRWRERLAGERTMLVAERDGEALGSVSFGEREEFPRLLYLFALAVVEPFQRQGIGSRLVVSVEAEARRRGVEGICLAVAVDNEGAIRLYERLGYRRTGEPFISRWTWYGPDGETREIVERCYRMVRRLGSGGRLIVGKRVGHPRLKAGHQI